MVGYKKPDVKLLKETVPVDTTKTDLCNKRIDALRAALKAYGFAGEIVGVRPGPMVTTYEFRPEISVRISDVQGAGVDIARAVSAAYVNIAHIPHTDLIGIEIDNESKQNIRVGGLIADAEFENPDRQIPLALGVGADGAPVYIDLKKKQNLLIAGRTGTGKSVFMQSIVMSLVYRFAPDECKLMIIDTKGFDFGSWDDIPHLITPVITDAEASINALKWVLREIDRRYDLFESAAAQTIEVYNKTATTRMPYIVVIVDEIADLMLTSKHDTEVCVQRIAQKARAAGIHLIVATQRHEANTITGVIKARFPNRISLRARDKVESMMILGQAGAENLLPCGDMLFSDAGRAPVRIHPAFIADDEITAVADHLRKQGGAEYVAGVTDDATMELSPAEMYARAV